MKKWIVVLSLLLVVQLGLAVALGLAGESYGVFQPKEKLLAFDPDGVDGLRIESPDGTLLLNKREGRWQLPDSGDFPADQQAVQRLLDKLAALQKGWPLATTAGAVRRFKVADDEFERKLTLLSNGSPKATLYVGTSPGFRKVHVRPEGDDAVYAVAFNSWEANPKRDDWIDKEILKLDQRQVERIELPGIVLQRQGDKLRPADLAENEKSNPDAVDKLVKKLTGLHVESLLGRTAKAEYRQDRPVLEVKLTRDGGQVLDYRFSKPEAGAYYILKRSDLEAYFKVADFAVKPLREVTRQKLVQLKSLDKSAMTAGGTTATGQSNRTAGGTSTTGQSHAGG